MSESDQWKTKYLAALDRLENKEAAWQEVESILRQSISRLTLAADTSDKRLTAQLETLRSALRKNASVDQISHQMETISDSILRLDKQRDGADEIKRQLKYLEANVDKLGAPDGLKRETRELKKQLRRASKENDLKSALAAYAGYVAQVMTWFDVPQSERTEGLFGRLFGRKETDASSDDPNATATTPVLTRPAHSPSDDSDDEDDEPPVFNTVLFDLIHRLDLPPESSTAFKRIAALLREPPTVAIAKQSVADIAALLAQARHQIEQEKKETESFLLLVTGRLEELDRSINETLSARDDSISQGAAIDANLSAEVAGIEQSVNEAHDVDQLKDSVRARVTGIQMQMDARKQMEHEQQQRAELEIQRLKDSLSQVQEESAALRLRLSKERERTLHDNLTGLYNRLAYDECIALEYERWQQDGSPLVLSIWDVDHFKHINDTYGHNAGDNILKILGKLLRQQSRKSDFVARFGGEEFTLVFPETDIETAFDVAEKLRKRIATAKFMYRGQEVSVTMSCGLAECLAGDSTDSLYRRANEARRIAKQSGRNVCKVAIPPVNTLEP